MSASSELISSRKKIAEILGDTMVLYTQNLRAWFRQKQSREDFDSEARKLLPLHAVHHHNQFLLAIITKCQSLGSTLASIDINTSHHIPNKATKREYPGKFKKSSGKPVKNDFQQRFQAPECGKLVLVPDRLEGDAHLTFCSREMTLPDIGMVHGRLLIEAWDSGIDEIDDDAVKLIMEAIKIQLKNVITAVLSRKNAYKLREQRFKYALGVQLPQTHLRNSSNITDLSQFSEATSISTRGAHMPTMKPSQESGQLEAAVQLACGGHIGHSRELITLYDLLDSLQVNKQVIASHTLYATTIERTIHNLWHPSNEEIEQQEKFERFVKDQSQTIT